MVQPSPDGQVPDVTDETPPVDDESTGLADLSRLLHEDSDSSSGLARVLAHVIGPAVDLSVTIGSPLEPEAIDSNDQRAQHFDALQMRAGQGPCQTAWERAGLVRTGDLRADDRWPLFSAMVADEPLLSVLALPVRVEGRVVGVVNGYSPDRDAFEGLGRGLLELAAFAASQVIQRLTDRRDLSAAVMNLRRALVSRPTIDQAKGVIMAHHDCDPDAAFDLLRTASQHQNVKVRDIAVQITQRPTQPPATGVPDPA